MAQGRPLSEMTTPAIGMTDEENRERRDQFIALINRMTKPELEKRLDQINSQVELRLQKEEKGTSELEWQRIMVGDELESR